MRSPFALLCLAFLCLASVGPGANTAQAAIVEVGFRATSDQFDTGPFSTGAAVSGRFLLDLDAPQGGTPSAPLYLAALQDLQVSIAGLPFSGDAADLKLTRLGADMIALSAEVGGGHGSVAGGIPGTDYLLRQLRFEARFPSVLFPDRLMELRLTNLTLLNVVFEFSHPMATHQQRSLVLGQGEFSALTAQVIPLPGVAWLFGSACLLPLLRQRIAVPRHA